MATIYSTATEYVANALTFHRGTAEDVLTVGVYHTTDPEEIPTVADFTTVTLVQPGDSLAEGDRTDVLSLIGPRDGDVELSTPGDYQRWILITTASEDIIRRPDVLEVL